MLAYPPIICTNLSLSSLDVFFNFYPVGVSIFLVGELISYYGIWLENITVTRDGFGWAGMRAGSRVVRLEY